MRKDERGAGRPIGVRMTLALRGKREPLRLTRQQRRRSFSLTTTSCCPSRIHHGLVLKPFMAPRVEMEDPHIKNPGWCSLQAHDQGVHRIPDVLIFPQNQLLLNHASSIWLANYTSSMPAERGKNHIPKHTRSENHTQNLAWDAKAARSGE